MADNLPGEVRNALDGMIAVRHLLDQVDNAGELVGDLSWVVQHSYELGRLTERIPTWQVVDLVSIGGKTRKSQSDKAKKKRKFQTAEEKAQAKEIIKRYYNPPTDMSARGRQGLASTGLLPAG